MNHVSVWHLDGDRFAIAVRDHLLTVDQPLPDGTDSAPTPTELFVASLASCVAYQARQYLHRHSFSTDGLTVSADYAVTSGPSRIGRVDVSVHVPQSVPDDRLPALLAVASHCTVGNTLEHPPTLSVRIAGADEQPRPAPGSAQAQQAGGAVADGTT